MRHVQKLAQHADEPLDVGFVQRRVHLVQHAEGARVRAEKCEQERHAGERLLPAAQQRQVPQLLARGLGHDVHAAFQHVHPFFQHQLGPAAPEQLTEQLLEVFPNLLQRFQEQPPAVGVDPGDDLLQGASAAGQVLVLGGELLVAFFQLLEFFQGLLVHVAQRLELLPQLFDFFFGFAASGQQLAAALPVQFGQLDAVLFMEMGGQGLALGAQFLGGQFLGVQLVLQPLVFFLHLLPLPLGFLGGGLHLLQSGLGFAQRGQQLLPGQVPGVEQRGGLQGGPFRVADALEQFPLAALELFQLLGHALDVVAAGLQLLPDPLKAFFVFGQLDFGRRGQLGGFLPLLFQAEALLFQGVQFPAALSGPGFQLVQFGAALLQFHLGLFQLFHGQGRLAAEAVVLLGQLFALLVEPLEFVPELEQLLVGAMGGLLGLLQALLLLVDAVA